MSKQGEIDYPSKQPSLEWLYSKPFGNTPVISGKEITRFGWLLRIMHPRPGSRVLDVGMGPGWTSLFLARMGASVTGVDLSGKMVEIASKKAQNEGVEAEFLCLDIEETLPENMQEQFDHVFFYDSLHHIERTDLAFKHCRDALKPGGSILLNEPNLLHRFSRESREIAEKFDVTEQGFSWWFLRSQLKKAGFTRIRRYFNPPRRPMSFRNPVDLLEGLFWGFLEVLFLNHWKTSLIISARKSHTKEKAS